MSAKPWLTDADIYDEKGAPTVIGERSMTVQEPVYSLILRVALRRYRPPEADAVRWRMGGEHW